MCRDCQCRVRILLVWSIAVTIHGTTFHMVITFNLFIINMIYFAFTPYIAHVPFRHDSNIISNYYFSIPLTFFSLLFSLPASRSLDLRFFSSPLPTTLRALHVYRENTSALSSLAESRRITPTHARRSQQLIPFCFCKEMKISPRRDWNSRNNTSSI